MEMRCHSSLASVALILGASLLAGCVSNPVVPEVPASAGLAPLAKPALSLSDVRRFRDIDSGEEERWTVTEVDGADITIEDSSGCSWVSDGDPTRPSTTWRNCGDGSWASGGSKDNKIKGGLWPLAVGNKVVYSQRFYNTLGDEGPSRTRKTCTVAAEVSVTVQQTPIDAYKVVCNQNYSDRQQRVYWFAPEVGLVQYDKGRGGAQTRRLARLL